MARDCVVSAAADRPFRTVSRPQKQTFVNVCLHILCRAESASLRTVGLGSISGQGRGSSSQPCTSNITRPAKLLARDGQIPWSLLYCSDSKHKIGGRAERNKTLHHITLTKSPRNADVVYPNRTYATGKALLVEPLRAQVPGLRHLSDRTQNGSCKCLRFCACQAKFEVGAA